MLRQMTRKQIDTLNFYDDVASKKITKLHEKKNKICFSHFSPSIYSFFFSQHKKNLNPIYKNQPSGKAVDP